MDRLKRKKLIRALIQNQQLGSQHELMDELKKQNIIVTQATLSRDINELGIKKIKNHDGFKYVLDEEKLIINTRVLLNYEVIEVTNNEVGIYIKTLPGRASGVADLVDKVGKDLILTTIAGDNTIFIVPYSINDISLLKEKIENFIDNKEQLNRKKIIKTLIKNHKIESQQELLHLLQLENIRITQATLSRDMKELGIKKTYPKNNDSFYDFDQKELILSTLALISYEVIDIVSNEIGVFIKTLPGRANGVAELIDTINNEHILTTIAGDNSIFVIPKSIKNIAQVKKTLELFVDGFINEESRVQ